MTGAEELGKSLYLCLQEGMLKMYPNNTGYETWEEVEELDKEVYMEAASNFLGSNAEAV